MKKILLFSRDPGGANTVIPLFKPLEDKGYEVNLYGKDVALMKYLHAGLLGKDISFELEEINEEIVKKFLEVLKPDIIITGTSADDMIEKYLWKTSGELGITSVAILDQWINYGVRFSRYGVSELYLYENDREHIYLPTKIMVMDEYAKKEMVKDGVEESRIIVTGQPYFETLFQCQNTFDIEKRLETRSKLGVDHEFVITFVSEPITKTYKETDTDHGYWGYNEKTVFNKLYDSLDKILADVNKCICLVIKPHPKEDRNSYLNVLKKYNNKFKIVINNDISPRDLIMASDLICGMSSMLLIEAVLLKLPIMSVQIGLTKEDPFILSRRGIVETILNEEKLIEELRRNILCKESINYDFEVIREPVKNILAYVEGLICHS